MDKFKTSISRREFFAAVAETIKTEGPNVRYVSAYGEELPTAGSVAGCRDWSALADRLGIPKECTHSRVGTNSRGSFECVECGEELTPNWTVK